MKTLFNPYGISVEEHPLKRFLPALALSVIFAYAFQNSSILMDKILCGLLFIVLLPFDKNYYKPFGSKFLILTSVLFWCALFFENAIFSKFYLFICIVILRISQEHLDKGTKTYSWSFRVIAFAFTQPIFEPIYFGAKYANRIFYKLNLTSNFLKNFGAYFIIFLVGALFVGLFCVASPQFDSLVSFLFEIICENKIPDLSSFFSWLFLSWICFGLFSITCYNSLTKSFEESMMEEEFVAPQNFSKWTIKILTIALVVFNLIFLLQNIFDIKYILSGCTLPKGMTYARFAMDGAFALAIATLLAAGIIIFCLKNNAQENMRTIHILAYAWIVQNIMLCISSCLRLISYTSVYDITISRIYGFIFFLIVFVGFLLTAVKIAKNKPIRWLIDSNIYSVVLIFAITVNCDIQKFVANYNVNHFLEKNNKLDFEYLISLNPDSVIPAMIKLVSSEKNQFANAAKTYLEEQEKNYAMENFEGQNFDYKKYQTKKLLKINPKK